MLPTIGIGADIGQVPIDTTTIKTLYVFVEISIDSWHLAETVRLNFPDDRDSFHDLLLSSEETRSQLPAGTTLGVGKHLRIEGPQRESAPTSTPGKYTSSPRHPTRLALVSTIQFAAALQRLKEDLSVAVPEDGHFKNSSRFWTGAYEATIPRAKPLSPGELLGCTAPALQDVDALLWA